MSSGDLSLSPADRFERIISTFEKVGQVIPHPACVFVWGIFSVFFLSLVLSHFNFEAIDPKTGSNIQIINLLSTNYLTDFFSRVVSIFSQFPPLGMTLIIMMSVGVLEESGWIRAMISLLLRSHSVKFLTPTLALVGLLSQIGGDCGYLIVISLGGLIFQASGRHPLAGIATAFASVSGGLCASIIPNTVDFLLQSLTEPAAQIFDPQIVVSPLCNYYFTLFSSMMIISLTWLITDRIVEPRLHQIKIENEKNQVVSSKSHLLTPPERKALIGSWLVVLCSLGSLLLILYPPASPFRDPGGGLFSSHAPLMKASVPIIALLLGFVGLVFGFMSGRFQNSQNIFDAMAKSIEGLGSYIVMVFFCALFLEVFSASNLGSLLAVKGGEGVSILQLSPSLSLWAIIILCSLLNLVIVSMVGKWALLAPIIVPILMKLGISPELAQAAYRIGDSSTNIITPLNPYFPLVLTCSLKFAPTITAGNLLSLMILYSIPFLVCWSAVLFIFISLGIPLGI